MVTGPSRAAAVGLGLRRVRLTGGGGGDRAAPLKT